MASLGPGWSGCSPSLHIKTSEVSSAFLLVVFFLASSPSRQVSRQCDNLAWSVSDEFDVQVQANVKKREVRAPSIRL